MEQTFGTKPEEDLSYKNSNTLMICTTVCMFAFCILEIVFYYLYNRKVSQLSLRILCILYGVLHDLKLILFPNPLFRFSCTLG